MQNTPRSPRTALVALLLAALAGPVHGHGDTVPQAVDTHTLPALGDAPQARNPYAAGAAHAEAVRIGSSAYNQNCARCHGLEAVSGGIAPDLRKLNADCGAFESPDAECLAEVDQYFYDTVAKGRVREGRVYMPPFKDIFSQEAIWAIRSYIDTRRPD
ncbi:cytochrome c-550 PedF [Dokdonella koreensis]|uniref:Cytochrome C550 n=1 Tax=Dokdonella koreensis DS-123 TaxID=1300342 RepID=A0A167GPT3_9GAMM|nr:cytochrome c-550 PedF [Dokdonella koreensis]ANB17012.1 Cytochrome C550 [Dokdonella koreensis DS-123]